MFHGVRTNEACDHCFKINLTLTPDASFLAASPTTCLIILLPSGLTKQVDSKVVLSDVLKQSG